MKRNLPLVAIMVMASIYGKLTTRGTNQGNFNFILSKISFNAEQIMKSFIYQFIHSFFFCLSIDLFCLTLRQREVPWSRANGRNDNFITSLRCPISLLMQLIKSNHWKCTFENLLDHVFNNIPLARFWYSEMHFIFLCCCGDSSLGRIEFWGSYGQIYRMPLLSPKLDEI